MHNFQLDFMSRLIKGRSRLLLCREHVTKCKLLVEKYLQLISCGLRHLLCAHILSVLRVFQTTNLVFFVLTTNKLFETWRLTKVESNSDYRITPRAQRNSSNFKVVLKIFVIMGVTWFSELFGFILSWIYGRNKVWKFFVLNDVINLLQGVFIFIVLVCKSSVFSQLWPGLNKNREKKISINAVTKETSLN